MIDELKFLLLWIVVIELIGLAFLPITAWWGKTLFGRALASSRLLGTVILGILAWQGAFLSILPFTQPILFFLLFVAIGINWSGFAKRRTAERACDLFKLYAISSLSFWIPFFAMLVIRGFNPHIHIYEKFMDMGIVNGLLRTQWLPAQDIWFAGESINYYYFGHFIAALLTKLSNVPSTLSYNFMIATITGWIGALAFTFPSTMVWKLCQNRVSAIKAGVLGALLVICSGTFFTFSFLFVDHKEPHWYWSSIRLIPGAIHEMPSYSLFVADLHAHLLNIPFNLLIITHLLTIYFATTASNQKWYANIARYFILGILLAVSTMTSIWDGPIYLGLSGIIIVFAIARSNKIPDSVRKIILAGGIVLMTFGLNFFPFFRHFDTSISEGIGQVSDFTAFTQFLILWGLPIAIWLAGTLLLQQYIRKNPHHRTVTDVQPLILITGIWALVLLLIPEFMYIKDIYGGEFYRGNTIFKFYYQAFILFSLLSAIVVGTWTYFSKLKLTQFFKFLTLLGLSCTLVYPFQIAPSYYEQFSKWHGWNGIHFLDDSYPADREAIAWIQQNIPGQPVMLESAGSSYTQDNRISVFTGLPTVQGWMTHEWLWRGGYEKPAARTEEVSAIYQTDDQTFRRKLLQKYRVQYIYIGTLENQKYPALQVDALVALGNVVYANQTVQIIQLDNF